MNKKVESHSVGKLKIYIAPADKIKHETMTLWRKLFPKSVYIHLVQVAKAEGIMNATVYNTHFGFGNNDKIQIQSVEGDNSKLPMCIELVDKREKLEEFFLKHKNYLKGKVVIYKEVEFWDTE